MLRRKLLLNGASPHMIHDGQMPVTKFLLTKLYSRKYEGNETVVNVHTLYNKC